MYVGCRPATRLIANNSNRPPPPRSPSFSNRFNLIEFRTPIKGNAGILPFGCARCRVTFRIFRCAWITDQSQFRPVLFLTFFYKSMIWKIHKNPLLIANIANARLRQFNRLARFFTSDLVRLGPHPVLLNVSRFQVRINPWSIAVSAIFLQEHDTKNSQKFVNSNKTSQIRVKTNESTWPIQQIL